MSSADGILGPDFGQIMQSLPLAVYAFLCNGKDGVQNRGQIMQSLPLGVYTFLRNGKDGVQNRSYSVQQPRQNENSYNSVGIFDAVFVTNYVTKCNFTLSTTIWT